jgi:glycosyltransferase involved in cell wall biosynthesis
LALNTWHFYHPFVRIAYFSPLPPVRSGIADYSIELLGRLGHAHVVDVFVASPAELAVWSEGRGPFRALSAHDFVWRRLRTPYDLVIYQVGNARCHDYMWPYLFRWPGLVVLHDGHLHHARAWSLLHRRREDDYRAELAFNHPDLPPSAGEIGLGGFSGPLYYFWPMLRTVVDSARLVAVHNAQLAADLAVEFPATPVRTIPMGVADPASAAADAREITRARHGLAPEAVALAAFGGLTPEKRLDAVFASLAVARRYDSRVRLLLVGEAAAHYDAREAARAHRVEDLVTMTGFVPDEDLPGYLAAADVVVSLRWPSGRETSASWLRAIAAGRPTIITDLAQQADVPTLDPRSWSVLHAQPTLQAPEPVAVSIDILDEAHSLTLALKRLIGDAPLRATLGAAARQYWQAHHSLARMSDGYASVITEASERPDPSRPLPGHLRPDPAEHASTLVAAFDGVRLFGP